MKLFLPWIECGWVVFCTLHPVTVSFCHNSIAENSRSWMFFEDKSDAVCVQQATFPQSVERTYLQTADALIVLFSLMNSSDWFGRLVIFRTETLNLSLHVSVIRLFVLSVSSDKCRAGFGRLSTLSLLIHLRTVLILICRWAAGQSLD